MLKKSYHIVQKISNHQSNITNEEEISDVNIERSYRQLFDDINTVNDLLLADDYYKIIAKSFVFIQNRLPLSYELLEKNLKLCFNKEVEFNKTQTHKVSFTNIIKQICKSQRSIIYTIEITDNSVDINELCIRIMKNRLDNCGIWILGNLLGINTNIFALFDCFFIPGINREELEYLNKSIFIPKLHSDSLSGLFFFLNQTKLNKDNAPWLAKNPLFLK